MLHWWALNNGRCLRRRRCRWTSCGVTKLNQCRVKTGKVHALYKHFQISQVCQVSVHSPAAWSGATEKPWSKSNAAKMWMSVKVCQGLICPVYCDGAEMINITKEQGTQVCAHTHTPSAASLSTPSVASVFITVQSVLEQKTGWAKWSFNQKSECLAKHIHVSLYYVWMQRQTTSPNVEQFLWPLI